MQVAHRLGCEQGALVTARGEEAFAGVASGGQVLDRGVHQLFGLETVASVSGGMQMARQALARADARMQWNCADPAQLAEWRPGVEVLASHTFSSLPGPMYDDLPAPVQEMLSGLAAQRLPRVEDYRLNLVRLP